MTCRAGVGARHVAAVFIAGREICGRSYIPAAVAATYTLAAGSSGGEGVYWPALDIVSRIGCVILLRVSSRWCCAVSDVGTHTPGQRRHHLACHGFQNGRLLFSLERLL